MKKIIFLVSSLFLVLCSCSSDSNKLEIEGKIKGNKYNGKTVYLYMIDSNSFEEYILLGKTTVEEERFVFANYMDANVSEKEMPTIGFVSLFDLTDEGIMMNPENTLPVATLILERGQVELTFDENSVSLSGTPRNERFNELHQAITEIVLFAQKTDYLDLEDIPVDETGKDGRAQFQELDKKLKDLTYSITETNMTNHVGEFLFLKSFLDNRFTPHQMIDLINKGTDDFKQRAEVKDLKEILDTMNEGLLPEFEIE